jgi:hypothetical protein
VVPGVPQIVEVHAVQAGCGQSRHPDPGPEVGVPQQPAVGTDEGQRRRVGGRAAGQVRTDVRQDQRRDRDDAAARIGLGRAELRRLAATRALAIHRRRSQ